jgi:hypothetical protein
MKTPLSNHPRLGLILVGGICLAAVASAQTLNLTNSWSIATGVRDYVTSGTTERGIAINPVNDHVYLVSRAGGLRVKVLEVATGVELLGDIYTEFIAGGTFPLSTIGVADDGVIYAANLVNPATESSLFAIYRWLAEDQAYDEVYRGTLSDGMRFGDSLDVRGSGLNTQIAVGTANAVNDVRFVIFTTADGNTFTPNAFSPAGVAAGALQKGITFGPENTVIGKVNGNPAKYISFDLASGGSALIQDIPIHTSISPVDYEPEYQLLAGINYVAHELLVYDVADLANPLQIAAFPFPAPATSNGNGVGAVDFGPGWLVAVETQNGVLGIKIEELTTPIPPSIGTQPLAQDVLEGAAVSFSVGATGSKPLAYQWFRNDEPIVDATNATYNIAGVTPAQAGSYKVTVSNAVDAVTSEEVALEVRALVKSGRLVPLWSKGIGDYAWLANDNAHRGMAYNPVSGNVLVVSRTLGTTNVYVLDGETGAERHQLRSTDANDANFIFGGLFPLNMIAVADDGAVYACCLTLSGTDTTIYRWADDQPDTIPTLAFGPADSGLVRTGDTIQARGSGVDTQLILASRSGKTVAIFTTADGATFTPTVVTTAEAADGNFGLGVAFGSGDTFWGNATGTNNPLTHVAFNLSAGTGSVQQRYADDLVPSYLSAIGVLPGQSLLAALALDTPDNVHLYDLSDPDLPVLVHQELLPSDNTNLNGTGAIDFGDNRLYVLGSNNGIAAFELREGTPLADPAVLGIPTWADGEWTIPLSGTVGAVYTLRRSADLADWTDVGSYTIPAGGTTNVMQALSGSAAFYQAVAP